MVKNVFLYNKNLISLSNRFSVNNLDKVRHKVKRIEIGEFFFKNNAYNSGYSARISQLCVASCLVSVFLSISGCLDGVSNAVW